MYMYMEIFLAGAVFDNVLYVLCGFYFTMMMGRLLLIHRVLKRLESLCLSKEPKLSLSTMCSVFIWKAG